MASIAASRSTGPSARRSCTASSTARVAETSTRPEAGTNLASSDRDARVIARAMSARPSSALSQAASRSSAG